MGDAGLLARCLAEARELGGGGGESDGERPRCLLRSARSLPGDDLLESLADEENTGEGVRRMRGGEGVTGARFLYGDLDRRLLLGDRLRDLRFEEKKKNNGSNYENRNFFQVYPQNSIPGRFDP